MKSVVGGGEGEQQQPEQPRGNHALQNENRAIQRNQKIDVPAEGAFDFKAGGQVAAGVPVPADHQHHKYRRSHIRPSSAR